MAVRFAGTVYVEGGSTTRDGVSLGQGEESSCADVGREAGGTYFADDPAQVALWSLEGLDPAHVVAVQELGGFRVFLAEDLSASDRQEIEAALSAR